MRVVVAPSAFKGTLEATEAAVVLSEAVAEALPDAEILRRPIADGGDGTMAVLVTSLGGEVIPATAMGPLGRPVDSYFGWLPGDVAIVELAAASGLGLLEPEQLDPIHSTTRGTGDLIAIALERRPRRVIVGVGGSATNDGGSGIGEALGVALLDSRGAGIPPGAHGLLGLERIDTTRRDPNLRNVKLEVACDVTNPLLGPEGAARTFAPQKGASTKEVDLIEAALSRFAEVVEGDLGVSLAGMPRAGAAGGAAGGMHALLGAELRDGFELLAEMIDFDRALEGCDLLIVGEGRLDRQSLAGKGPVGAARRAKQRNIPVWAIAGRVELESEALAKEGITKAVSLEDFVGREAIENPAGTLHRVARDILAKGFK